MPHPTIFAKTRFAAALHPQQEEFFFDAEDEEATFFDAEDELENSEPTSFAKFFFDTVCGYATEHPFQTVALLWAIKTLASDTTSIISYLKPLEQFIDKSFSASPTVSSWFTQAACAYGARSMLHNNLQATHSLVLASLTSLFSSAAAQPWQAIYPGGYFLNNLDGRVGTKISLDNAHVPPTGVSGVGDVNGDKKPDFLIGASGDDAAGVAYLIYGGDWLNTPTFSISNLNGTTGVKLLGVSPSDNTGFSVSSAGDVDGDGNPDFLIGAPGVNQSRGAAYLIYGGAWLSTSNFSLANLNGTTGVKLLGVSAGDGAGSTLSSAGDVDGDGKSDFLIGAPGVNQSRGAVYLLYGGPWLNSPTFSLRNINGTNGVKLLGVSVGEQAGYSLSSGGDVDGDGKPDFLIGAPSVSAYLVYGGAWLNTPTFSLNNLNGTNGVRLLGGSSYTGSSVSMLGDVNGDRKADLLIGDPEGTPFLGGANYLIYGGSWLQTPHFLFTNPNLVNNLDGINGVKLSDDYNPNIVCDSSGFMVGSPGDFDGDGRADFLIECENFVYLVYGSSQLNTPTVDFSHVSGVRFACGFNIAESSLFSTAGDMNSDGAMDFLIGDPRNGKVYLINGFGFTLWSNTLALSRADKIIINTAMLNTTGVVIPPKLIITTNNIQHGYFELVTHPGKVITNFTQQQINHAQVRFIHDGSGFAPSYTVTVTAPTAASISAVPAQVTFNSNPPALVRNNLIISRAQTIQLSAKQLNSSNIPTFWPLNTTFVFGNIENGHFESITNPGKMITSATQTEINEGQVLFIHDGSGFAPSYSVVLSDPGMSVSSQFAQITFTQNAPLLINNQLTITQGQSFVLGNKEIRSLSIAYPDLSSHFLKISGIQYGHFEFIVQPGQAITTFTQQQINQGQVQFVHDGNCNASAYMTTLSDPGMTLPADPAQISFSLLSRSLDSNHLTIGQGETLTLEPTQLSSSGVNYADTQNLQILITNPLHIRFSSLSFLQKEVSLGQIKVTHDGSLSAPSYQVSIINCGQTYGPWSAAIAFKPTQLNPSPTDSAPNLASIIRGSLIGSAVSGGAGLVFFVLKFYLDYLGQKRLRRALEKNNTLDSAKIEFHQNVIVPIAEKVFSVITVTGIFSDNSKEKMNLYRDAVIHLVDELNRAGIDIELEKMDPLRKSAFLSTVARQTKKHVVPDVGCCSPQKASRFFVAHASPEDIWNKSPAIALAVKKDLDNASARESLARQSELTRHDSMNMPLLSLPR